MWWWGWVKTGTDYKFTPAVKGLLWAVSLDLSVSGDLEVKRQSGPFLTSSIWVIVKGKTKCIKGTYIFLP
jgi:hypothetical protein